VTTQVKMFSTVEQEGMERACILFLVPTHSGNMAYLCYRWGKFPDHWLLETPKGDQVEVHGHVTCIVHVPKPGFTFDLDGTCREVRPESKLVVN
jgi:hypothetical protein